MAKLDIVSLAATKAKGETTLTEIYEGLLELVRVAERQVSILKSVFWSASRSVSTTSHDGGVHQ
jgi:hypothetical protein